MRPKSRRFEIVVAVLLAMIGAGALSAQERKITVPASELPDAVREAIQKAFPGDRILIIEKEVQGEDPGQYDVEIRSGDTEYEIEISPEGKIIETKETAAEDQGAGSGEGKKWTDSFGQEECTFSSLGRNPFFILVPGHQLTLESSEEKVVITVLDKTKKIGNVETRVVEEREEENGELKEVSRNFFATCREHGDVFYFGEEVDDYDEGEIVGATVIYEAEIVRDGKEFDVRVSAAGEYLGIEQEEEDEDAEESD